MRRHMKRLGSRALLFLLCTLFYCEFLVYYLVLSQCSYPTSSSTGSTRAMVLADTHLLGSRKGHWFDKLRREWQMHRWVFYQKISFNRVFLAVSGPSRQPRLISVLSMYSFLATSLTRASGALPRNLSTMSKGACNHISLQLEIALFHFQVPLFVSVWEKYQNSRCPWQPWHGLPLCSQSLSGQEI